MNLSETIRPETVGINVKIGTKADALRRIAELARQSPGLGSVDVESIYDQLQAREKIGSTGFGDGIAIPHCRFADITEFSVGVLTLEKGIDFDSMDGKPVRIIAFIVGPESATTRHLKLLSALSLALSSGETRAAMLSAATAEQLIAAVGGDAGRTEVSGQTTERRLFHIVVQNESIFHRLLEVFEGVEGTSVTVIESRNTGSYLARLPLFASLLSDDEDSFNRIIIAVVERAMSNEAIRRIEIVTGPLDQRDDILAIVQDIHYAAGALSI